MKIRCNKCLVSTTCIDPCDKFSVKKEDILPFLCSNINAIRRLCSHCRKKWRGRKYKLNEKDHIKFFPNGSVYLYRSKIDRSIWNIDNIFYYLNSEISKGK